MTAAASRWRARPAGAAPRPRARSLLAAAVAAVAAVLLGACSPAADGHGTSAPSPSASARPVTTEEAERLAVVRFRNYDAGARKVSASYTEQGHQVGLEGVFDYTTHTGAVSVTTDGAVTDTVVWDGGRVAIAPRPLPDGPDGPTPPASFDGWTVAPADPGGSSMGSLLAVVAALGADRPENPLLLRQGGALWLREDTVAGTPVTVFAGPVRPGDGTDGTEGPEDGTAGSPTGSVDPEAAGLRYWVDEQGRALRVEVRLGSTWARVDLRDTEARVAALPGPTAGDDGAAP
ncbi:hypothetical protein DNL40_02925 [Xylanimonas oleitrophica]|uniref:Lipoprotein n=1 Tax=Xylanimonas oleitrophica TaxID=2607479 RepID=A0A2W5WV43_9MICO|nr:hypothetical protein [Xylanimonas oleitrophica]PZR55339.1 hypothetical protein DNL40_02925 [Xylanimonas oleitrophica]